MGATQTRARHCISYPDFMTYPDFTNRPVAPKGLVLGYCRLGRHVVRYDFNGDHGKRQAGRKKLKWLAFGC